MNAYGILKGGGVKGAALAGCLAGAEARDIKFAGYSGTSAGSVVAVLAAVGYKGAEICDLMKGPLHPRRLLGDNGAALQMAQSQIQKVIEGLKSRSWVPGKKWYSVGKRCRAAWHQLQPLVEELGLYGGGQLRNVLLQLIQNRVTTLAGHADITFDDLKDAGCPQLKIVGSDITRRRPAIFSALDSTYGHSVVEAVRASTSYPFLFAPVNLPGNRRLADGGLASNLPIFLFHEEHDATRYPILAFDLIEEDPGGSQDYNLVKFCNDLLGTALEASDELIGRLLRGWKRIPVRVPKGITTLKVDLSDREIDALFEAGELDTRRSLDDWEPLKRSEAAEKLQQQLRVIYGPAELFEPVLWALQKMVEERTKARDVRASVMLPTGHRDGSRIVAYHYGFRREDQDGDLMLGQFGGCTGCCLEHRKAVIADLEEARSNYESKWRMTPEPQPSASAQ